MCIKKVILNKVILILRILYPKERAESRGRSLSESRQDLRSNRTRFPNNSKRKFIYRHMWPEISLGRASSGITSRALADMEKQPDHVYYRWHRSTLNRLSIDSRPTGRPTVDRLSTESRSSVVRSSIDVRPPISDSRSRVNDDRSTVG